MAKSTVLLLNLLIFILALQLNLAFTTSSPETLISTTSKEQIACMLCQPSPSPPPPKLIPCPPPPVPSPPPPSPPPPSPPKLPECPPPPAPPTLPDCPPPPAPPTLPECPPPPAPPKLPECPPPPAPPKNCSQCAPSPNVSHLSPPGIPMPFSPPSGEFVPPIINVPYPPLEEASDSAKLVLKFINISSASLLLSLLCCF